MGQKFRPHGSPTYRELTVYVTLLLTEHTNTSVESESVESADTLNVTSGKLVGGEVVLLKTAIVSVSNATHNFECKGRVLFDDCSTRTYITQSLCNELNLQPISKRKVLIKGACKSSSLRNCDVVQFKIQTNDPAIKIVLTASVLDEICHPIEGQSISTIEFQTIPLPKHRYSHWRRLLL